MIYKTPQAGEFWEWAGERLRIIGTRNDGRIVGENQAGGLEMSCHIFDMTHLPDCDSFDWQPETFPQWYACGNSIGWGITAYVVRDTANTYFCVETNGNEVRSNAYVFEQGLVNSGHWKQVTQAEAEARVKKPEPVESPDDWVTQDRVPARVGIDSEHWSNWGVYEWHVIGPKQISAQRKMMHGNVDEQEDTLSLRCRRRDLPPMPQETPKREYVRCFTTLEGTVRTAKDISEVDMPKLWYELKHDGTGFYLEDGK